MALQRMAQSTPTGKGWEPPLINGSYSEKMAPAPVFGGCIIFKGIFEFCILLDAQTSCGSVRTCECIGLIRRGREERVDSLLCSAKGLGVYLFYVHRSMSSVSLHFLIIRAVITVLVEYQPCECLHFLISRAVYKASRNHRTWRQPCMYTHT